MDLQFYSFAIDTRFNLFSVWRAWFSGNIFKLLWVAVGWLLWVAVDSMKLNGSLHVHGRESIARSRLAVRWQKGPLDWQPRELSMKSIFSSALYYYASEIIVAKTNGNGSVLIDYVFTIAAARGEYIVDGFLFVLILLRSMCFGCTFSNELFDAVAIYRAKWTCVVFIYLSDESSLFWRSMPIPRSSVGL